MTVASTWSRSANEFKGYKNGVQEGVTKVDLGTWVGDLAPTLAVVGALSTVPSAVWSGSIGPVAIFNEAKSPTEMKYLMTP